MNLGDARTRVSGEVGLSNKSASSEQKLIDGWWNDGVVQFLMETKCFIKQFDMLLTAGVADYDLPTNLLAFKELEIVPGDGSTARILEPLSTHEVKERRRFPSSGFQPIGYSVEGWNLLMLSTSVVSSSDQLTGLYVPRPTPMTDPTHDPSNPTYGGIPTEFHETLVQYPLWKSAIWDDDISSAGFGRRYALSLGTTYQTAWENGIKDAKMKLAKRKGVRWAPARPGGQRRRLMYMPPTPGTDTGR